MLQSIRDRTQGWIAGVIISLLIVSFALWGIHSYMNGGGASNTVAKVNGEEIDKRQLNMAYEPLRNQSMMTNGTAPSEKQQDLLRQQALKLLITIQVLKQDSVDQHYKVGISQIDNYIRQMPQFQVNGQFSSEKMQQALAASVLGPNELIESIGTTLLIDQPRLGLILSSFALPKEINSTVTLMNQQRDIEYLILPKNDFLKEISVSAAEVKAYYDQHKEDYKTPEQVSLEYLALSIPELMNKVTVSDDAIKKAYSDNQNTYSTPKEWHLEEIFVPVKNMLDNAALDAGKKQALQIQQQLSSGANFTSLAAANPYSQANAALVTHDKIPQELQAAVADLKEGAISDPIQTPNGFVLVKVAKLQEARVQSFDEAKGKVKADLQRQKAEEIFADTKDKLANLTYETPTSLDQAAKELSLTVHQTGLFTKDKGATETSASNKEDITQNKKIREVAFTPDVLISQNNSDVIQVSPDIAVVLRIKDHNPASIMPLQMVEKDITTKLQIMKAEQKANAQANQIIAELQKGTTSQQITDKYHAVWKDAGFVGRYDAKVDSAILYSAFKLGKPSAGKNLFSAVKVPSGYAVVAVTAVKDGVLDSNSQQDEAFIDQLQDSEGALEYTLYEKNLMNKAKIEITQD